ncbi:hypothetical protein G6F68_017049 [Rhizopus microsporus]|nr:hypothetical protein G6F68_017049 [Rhizopus microsporus]
MQRLALHRAERTEVVLAKQGLAGGMHQGLVQRPPLPAQGLPAQRRPHFAVEQPIAVAARARGKTGEEIIGHRHAPAHRDRARQAGGGAEHPGARIAHHLGVEMHDLALAVHPSIGPVQGWPARWGHLRPGSASP